MNTSKYATFHKIFCFIKFFSLSGNCLQVVRNLQNLTAQTKGDDCTCETYCELEQQIIIAKKLNLPTEHTEEPQHLLNIYNERIEDVRCI